MERVKLQMERARTESALCAFRLGCYLVWCAAGGSHLIPQQMPCCSSKAQAESARYRSDATEALAKLESAMRAAEEHRTIDGPERRSSRSHDYDSRRSDGVDAERERWKQSADAESHAIVEAIEAERDRWRQSAEAKAHAMVDLNAQVQELQSKHSALLEQQHVRRRSAPPCANAARFLRPLELHNIAE